jgi:hypothetical protein
MGGCATIAFVFASRAVSVLHYDDLAGMRALVRYALADDARIRLLASASSADELLDQVAEVFSRCRGP